MTQHQPPDSQRSGLVASLKAVGAFVAALAVGLLVPKRRRAGDAAAQAAQHAGQSHQQEPEMLRGQHSYASMTLAALRGAAAGAAAGGLYQRYVQPAEV